MIMSKEFHLIEVHYPESKEAIVGLMRRIGRAYGIFVKDYIITLPISNKEKNQLYASIAGYLHNQNNGSRNDGI